MDDSASRLAWKDFTRRIWVPESNPRQISIDHRAIASVRSVDYCPFGIDVDSGILVDAVMCPDDDKAHIRIDDRTHTSEGR
jgi:hypothetical protein